MDKSVSVGSKSIMQKMLLLRIFLLVFITNFAFAFSVKSLQELHNQNVIRQQ